MFFVAAALFLILGFNFRMHKTSSVFFSLLCLKPPLKIIWLNVNICFDLHSDDGIKNFSSSVHSHNINIIFN